MYRLYWVEYNACPANLVMESPSILSGGQQEVAPARPGTAT